MTKHAKNSDRLQLVEVTLHEKVDSPEEASLLLQGVHDGKAEDEETVLG